MPNKRAANKQGVTVFLGRDLVAAAKAAAAGRGETLTSVIEKALTEYAARPSDPDAKD